MKRIKLFLLACVLFVLCVAGFTACDKEDADVDCTLVSASDTRVVIVIDEVEGKPVLLDAMKELREDRELSFTYYDGMITEINGVANGTNDYWMIYTSDKKMASTEWGTIEYNGITLGSAVVGVKDLPVVTNGIYVWVYQSV